MIDRRTFAFGVGSLAASLALPAKAAKLSLIDPDGRFRPDTPAMAVRRKLRADYRRLAITKPRLQASSARIVEQSSAFLAAAPNPGLPRAVQLKEAKAMLVEAYSMPPSHFRGCLLHWLRVAVEEINTGESKPIIGFADPTVLMAEFNERVNRFAVTERGFTPEGMPLSARSE